MLQHLSQCGSKSFCPWCPKLGWTLKWSPSILERCTIGWWSHVTYASHSLAWKHRESWTTILDAKPSVTRNAQNRRDMKGWKSHTRWSPSPRDKRRHPNYPDQMSPRSHKKQNATQHLQSSAAGECKLLHFLNLSGSSQLHCLGKSSLSQTNCHFFLQSQCL